MGIIRQGILGGFSGKVGTVIGSSWKGIAYMRGRAQSIKNPRTPAQVEHRAKFKLVSDFVTAIAPYIRLGYKSTSGKLPPLNAATSFIMKNAVGGGYPNNTVLFDQALVSRGSLTPADNVQMNVTEGTVTFTWTDNSGVGNALATDKPMPLAYNPNNHESVYLLDTTAKRSDGTVTINVPKSWVALNVHYYLGFTSADGQMQANSVYLGEHVLQNWE